MGQSKRWCPPGNIVPGWEITAQKSKPLFLLEVISQLADGTRILVEEEIDFGVLTNLEPHFDACETTKGVFRSQFFQFYLRGPARKLFTEIVSSVVDLDRQWCSITAFSEDELYFESCDFMYESGPFLTELFAEELLAGWKRAGVIEEYERFTPSA